MMGKTLNLSRPTMSAAIAELERSQLVQSIGEVRGAVGRRASSYRLGSGAGYVIAVDAGSTHVGLRVSTLDRRLLHSRVYTLASSQPKLSEEISRAVDREVTAALAEYQPEWGPLRAVGVALPSRVVPEHGDVESTGQNQIFAHFTPPEGVAVILENNVNCAAVAEQSHGCAQSIDTFAYVQVGVKIGLGLIVEGKLIRGRNGSAGEIGHLTFPFGPGLVPEPAAVEKYLGAEGFLARVQAEWPSGGIPAPLDTAELLSRAANGDTVAGQFVERHATDIGALVANCISVVDPGFVVLGGGLGASPHLLPGVRREAARLAYPADIVSSALGRDATILGIEKLAIEHALSLILTA